MASPKLRLTFTDGTPTTDVRFGPFAQIAAKRRYGLEVVRTEDAEPALFGAWVELHGPKVTAGDDVAERFDAWLQTLEDFELVTEEAGGANPPPAETSSPTSPDSPPTSE